MAEKFERPHGIVLSRRGSTGLVSSQVDLQVIVTENTDIEKWQYQKPAYVAVALIIGIIGFTVFFPLIITSNFLDFNKSVFLMPPSPPCTDPCRLVLVESIPENLTYPAGSPSHLSIFEGWKNLIRLANQTIDIASFYWTLRGSDVYEDPSAWQGEEIYKDLLNAGSKHGIKIRIAQNVESKEFPQKDTKDFVKAGAAEVRSLNFTHFEGMGILHTKMMLVDGKHFYVGSANYDWRSLTQVKELGTITYDCKCLAQDMMKIFEVYWYMGAPNATLPPIWPPKYNTHFNQFTPMKVQFNSTNAAVFIASSPPHLCPTGRTTDIDAILHVIASANKFVYVAVMDYSPTLLYSLRHRFWPVIDDSLRKIALEKDVVVRVLASWWQDSREDMPYYLRSLAALTGALGARIEVKLFKVPATEAQKKIPFARVNHNKYMVTDNAAYVGTSNWSGDYFVSTGGIGYVINQTAAALKQESDAIVQRQLLEVFERDWNSSYAHPVPKYLNQTTKKTEKQEL